MRSRKIVRLKLRLPFREWSQAIDKDGLASIRKWLAACEDIVNHRMQTNAPPK